MGRKEKMIIGHRGSRGLEPENTIPAFLTALDLGAKGLELDLYITRDEQVVVTHDATISHELCTSPAGQPLDKKESNHLKIYDLKLDQIKPFDCGSEPNPDFPYQQSTKAHIPLLSEVIEAVQKHAGKENPVTFFLELKSDKSTDHILHPEPAVFVEKVLEIVKEKNVSDQCIFIGFDKRCLREAKEQAPEVQTGVSLDKADDFTSQIEELGFLPNSLLPQFGEVNEEMMAYAKARELQVFPWTVNEERDMQQVLQADVDGLITDYPDKALKLLNKE